MFKNICLIGLPYAGKSYLGKKLAFNKRVGFIETDKMIQYKYKDPLKKIIKLRGVSSFLYMEEKTAMSIHCENTVISTGGSMVYSVESIRHFKKNLNCEIIHLHLSLDEFKKRVNNLEERGVVNPYNLNLEGLYNERTRLCELYSDKSILADNKDLALKNLFKLYVEKIYCI